MTHVSLQDIPMCVCHWIVQKHWRSLRRNLDLSSKTWHQLIAAHMSYALLLQLLSGEKKKKTKCKAVCNENHVLSISSPQQHPSPPFPICALQALTIVASHFLLPSEAVCFCFQAWALSQETVYTLGAFRKGRAPFPLAPSLVTSKKKKKSKTGQ